MNDNKSSKFFWGLVLLAITIGAVSSFGSNEFTNQIKEKINIELKDIKNDNVVIPVEDEDI